MGPGPVRRAIMGSRVTREAAHGLFQQPHLSAMTRAVRHAVALGVTRGLPRGSSAGLHRPMGRCRLCGSCRAPRRRNSSGRVRRRALLATGRTVVGPVLGMTCTTMIGRWQVGMRFMPLRDMAGLRMPDSVIQARVARKRRRGFACGRMRRRRLPSRHRV
jgi:hypothetical protein